RHHQLHAVTPNDTQSLHVGIVDQPDRFSQFGCEYLRKGYAPPLFGAKVRSGVDYSLSDKSRKSYRYHIAVGKLPGQRLDRQYNLIWLTRRWCFYLLIFKRHFTLSIEHGGLNARPTDVDGKNSMVGQRVCHGLISACVIFHIRVIKLANTDEK